MNLESRKIEFVQEFLKFQSEEVVSYFEQLLYSLKKSKDLHDVHPITEEEFRNRISQAELDFKNGRYKSSQELLAKFE
jgi:hypothetical protein